MMTSMIKKLPSEWQPSWVSGESWYTWVEAMFTDFITMWNAVVLMPGLPTPHAHVAVPGIFLPTTTAMLATGYTGNPAGITSTYYNTLATTIAAHFNSGIVATNIAALGSVLHDHVIQVPPSPVYLPPPALPPYPWPPDYEFPATPPPPPPPPPVTTPPFSAVAGTATTLKASILGALSGIGIVGAENSLDILFTAICETMCEHVAYYAIVGQSIDPVIPPGHVHAVS